MTNHHNTQQQILKKINKIENSENFDINQFLNRCIYYKWIFIFSILIVLLMALMYYRTLETSYEIKATLLIYDGMKKGGETPLLQEIESSPLPKLVENEIEILKSRNLLSRVVNDLQTNIEYHLEIGTDIEELYHDKPIQFHLNNQAVNLKSQTIEIIIKDQKSFTYKIDDGPLKNAMFNNFYSDSFGDWKIESNKNLQNYIGIPIIITLHNPDKIVTSYQKGINVALANKNSPVVGLSFHDKIPARGKDVLNSLIDNYNETTILEKSKIVESTLNFIDIRLASLSGELDEAEGAVEVYRSSRGLTDISSQSMVYLQNVQRNDNQLNEVNVKLNVIEGIENYISSDENNGTPPSILGITDQGLANLIRQLSDLQLNKEELLATTPQGNPVFNPINRQINATKAAIKENIVNIKTALINTKRELEVYNKKFETSIRNIPSQERHFIGIKRQQSIKEGLYIYLLQKREELSLSYAATLTDARIVDSAYIASIKQPNVIIIFGGAFVMALILPFSFVFIISILSTRVESKKEIEDDILPPVLIELSYENSSNSLVIMNEKKLALSEQFRSLRTHLHYLHGNKKKGRVTLFTSSISEEGKSFVASNIGTALAISGRRTIILELDLRNPKILNTFKLPINHPGLTEYLRKKFYKEEIIQASGIHPKLDIIGSGNKVSNPSELLEQVGLDRLITYLRDNYDDIILDTPPVKLVTDALILSRFADVTLYIIRQGHTHKSLLPFVQSLYTDQHFPKMNIIFNGIVNKRYGYGTDYGKGYYGQNKYIFNN